MEWWYICFCQGNGLWVRSYSFSALYRLLQGVSKSCDRGKPSLWLFCQSMQKDGIYLLRESRVETAGWLRLVVQMLIHDLHRTSLKRRLACEKFVDHHCQCILIG